MNNRTRRFFQEVRDIGNCFRPRFRTIVKNDELVWKDLRVQQDLKENCRPSLQSTMASNRKMSYSGSSLNIALESIIE
ncbi:hypothetical protein Trydic_g23849 [Trypoxylus dichotomus]